MLTMRGHLLAVTQIVDAFDTLAKGPTYAASLGVEYWGQVVGYFVLALVAAAWSSRWFHAAFAAVSLSYTIWFLFRVTRPY
jgi:hypothetical protein